MKIKLLAALAVVSITGCTATNPADAKLEYMKNTDPFVQCQQIKNMANMTMISRQAGSSADQIYYGLKDGTSSYMIKRAFLYPLASSESDKEFIISEFTNTELMVCVNSFERFQRALK